MFKLRFPRSDCTCLILLVFATAAMVPNPVHADSVPPPQYEAQSSDTIASLSNFSGPGSVSVYGCETSAPTECAAGTATDFYSDGSASASVNGSTSGDIYSLSTNNAAGVAFFFTVAGPAGQSVPILIAGTGSTSVEPSETGTIAFASSTVAFFPIPNSDDGEEQLYGCSAIGTTAVCLSPSGYSATLAYDAIPGTVYEIDVGTTCDGGSGNTSCSASADPMVEINPAFAEASEYSLEFSPNPAGTGTGTAPTPEPSTVGLLALGLIGVGVIGRRKSRTAPGREAAE